METNRTRRGRVVTVVALAAAFLLGGAAFSAVQVAGATGSVTPEAVCTGYPHWGVDWQGCDVKYADLGSQYLGHADLARANLTGAILQGVTLTSADLAGANLTGAYLEGVISGGITGPPAALPSNWTLIGGYLIGPSDYLANAHLQGADLSGADL